MLLWTEDVILLEVVHDVAGDDVLHQLACNAGK
jgi:hypothetical protein